MEKAILIGLQQSTDTLFSNSMMELHNLAEACGVEVLHQITQKREIPTKNYYIGEGKVSEVKEAINTLDANLVIFNDELSPSHIRNLESNLETKVIDRTVLILDIFAKRAKTKEAMLQVELAQARYFLPRIIGMHKYLSRQKSGTGSKGPGEQQLELDRRYLRGRITKLKNNLNDIVKVRRTQREKRKKNNMFTVALTGYTNSGKSTLMNSLIDATSTLKDEHVYEKDMVFATLETKTKNIKLKNNHTFLLTDTVGFIDKLPHHLVEAFKSTLEEVTEASLILHVIDSSNPYYENQIRIVNEVLDSIGAKNVPTIYVFNKMDLANESPVTTLEPSISISATKKTNITDLLELIDEHLYKTITNVTMLIPYKKSEIYSLLKEKSNILNTEYKDDGIYIEVELDEYHYNKYLEYIE